MMKSRELLEKLAQSLLDPCSDLLVLAEQEGTLPIIAAAVVETVEIFRKASEEILEASITPEFLDEVAAIATAMQNSGEPELIKEASMLDELLLTFGTPQAEITKAKSAQDATIEKIKGQQDPFKKVKEEQDKDNKVEEARKLIADAIKKYRPLEHPLSTRTCPDHPGALMIRVADDVYQCAMDKAIYNYITGFTTMKGEKVPGGDVANQTQALFERPNEHTSFDTREHRLNRF